MPHDDFHYVLYTVLSSPAFQQIAPLVILILIPTLILFLNSHRHAISSAVLMVLESLAVILPWNWSDTSSTSSGSVRKLRRKAHTRSRDDQVARTSSTASHEGPNEGYYPGLVNISGTYCFMNSTMQAMASLAYLQPQLERIHAKAEALDVPTPVIDSLRELTHRLNTPSTSSHAIRPVDIISSLSNHSPGKHNSLFSSREHQDAQELFQLLSECVKTETVAVAKEIRRDRGLGGLTQSDERSSRDISKTVFDGLTANRRSCVQCGYTEAVMHFPFDNWQLAVPRLKSACQLEECLDDYTRLEVLNDCICRKCSMLATYHKLEKEAERLTEAAQASSDPSSKKKKRARESRKLLARVKTALDEGRIEEDIKGVTLEKVFSPASTKQSMIARPPPVLALHLNRSVHYGHYAAKNNCHVVFPELLDLTPYTTSGQLSTQPSLPISTPPPPMPISMHRSITPTPATYAVPRTLYRLSAVVCHYGQHSFGHYVCFRRKPRPPAAGDRRWAPPRLACPLGCNCARCATLGPVRDDDLPFGQGSAFAPGSGLGWLRISDDSVQEVGVERVLQEGSGAFMLYYERVHMPRALLYAGADPRASQETVRPKEEGKAGPPDAKYPATLSAAPREAGLAAVSAANGDASAPSSSSSRTRREHRDRDPRERYNDARVVRRVSASPSTPSSMPPPQPPPPKPQSQPQQPPAQQQSQSQPQPQPQSPRPTAPPMSRSTSASSYASAMTSVSAASTATTATTISTFSTTSAASGKSAASAVTANGDGRSASHTRAHSGSSSHSHRPPHISLPPGSSGADPEKTPRSPLPHPGPPPASPRSARLRKTRRSVSQADREVLGSGSLQP